MLSAVCTLLAVLARGIAVPFATPGHTPGRLAQARDPFAPQSESRVVVLPFSVTSVRDEEPALYFTTTTTEPESTGKAVTVVIPSGRGGVDGGVVVQEPAVQVRGNASTPSPVTLQQLRAPRPSPQSTTTTPTSSIEEDDDDSQEVSDDEDATTDWMHSLKTQFRLFLTCVPRWGAMSCLKLEAILLLQGSDEEAHLAEGNLLGLGGGSGEMQAESRHGAVLAAMSSRLSSDPRARDAYLNKMLVNAIHGILEDSLESLRDEDDNELRSRGIGRALARRRKGNRWASPLLALMFGLGALIIVAGIGKTAMVAGKALAVSTLALVIALVLGLRGAGGRRGGGGGGFGNYEVLATGLRRRAGIASGPSGGPPSGPGPGPGSGLQPFAHIYLDADADQAQAYSAHHTRP